MKFSPLPWVLLMLIFAASAWVRFYLVEQPALGFFCDNGGLTTECRIRGLTVQAFNHYGLGYFGLFFGVVAALSRFWLAAWLAAALGAAGLLLYTWDFSAVAFLLGSLTLARAQFEEYRNEHGAG